MTENPTILSGWQPIETAPRDGTPVWVGGHHSNGSPWMKQAWWAGVRAWETMWGRLSVRPDYWHPDLPPLPAPPAKTGEEG